MALLSLRLLTVAVSHTSAPREAPAIPVNTDATKLVVIILIILEMHQIPERTRLVNRTHNRPGPLQILMLAIWFNSITEH